MKNYQRYGWRYIDGQNFSASCAVYNTRSGFAHECTIYFNGCRYYAKKNYYNRTWENYEFQSVLYKAIEKLPKEYHDEIRGVCDAWGRGDAEKMAAKFEAFKKNFENVTVMDEAGFNAVCGVVGMMAALNK